MFSPSAQGDYEPGRVRESAEGLLSTVHSDGIYRYNPSVKVTEYQTDGKGITHYLVETGQITQLFAVTTTAQKRCNVVYRAKSIDSHPHDSVLVMDDRSNSLCRQGAKKPWTLKIETISDRLNSQILMAGDPEHFILSQ